MSTARPSLLLIAMLAALGAALAFAAIVVASILLPGDNGDHATVLGRTTESFAAIGFLLAAISLGALAPAAQRLLWAAGVVGLGASGITMLFVAHSTVEPPIWLFFTEIGLAGIGLVVIAVGAIRARVLPWWAAVCAGLTIPLMFVPFNGVFLALAWAAVAHGVRLRARRVEPAATARPVAMLPS